MLYLAVTFVEYIEAAKRGGNHALTTVSRYIADYRTNVDYINAIDQYDNTALIYASRYAHTETVNLLLAVPGIHINAVGRYGNTALICAAYYGCTNIVSILLEKITDINALKHKNQRRRTAIQEARYPLISELIQARIQELEELSNNREEKYDNSQRVYPAIFTQRLHAVEEKYKSKNIEYEVEIPDYLLCPISQDIMNYPVTFSSGISYDREEVRKYFSSRGNPLTIPDPITKIFKIKRNELKELRVSVFLKNLCEEFVAKEEKKVSFVMNSFLSSDKNVPSKNEGITIRRKEVALARVSFFDRQLNPIAKGKIQEVTELSSSRKMN